MNREYPTSYTHVWYGDAIAGDVYNIAGGYISCFCNNYEIANDKPCIATKSPTDLVNDSDLLNSQSTVIEFNC